MKKRTKKRAVTLIEIMIVILLIGLIGGALAFNMRGSMDQGRAFKTEQNMARIHDILLLEYAKGEQTLSEIAHDWKEVVKKSPIVKGDEILKDGWKNEFSVKVQPGDSEDVEITSKKLAAYKKDHAYKKK